MTRINAIFLGAAVVIGVLWCADVSINHPAFRTGVATAQASTTSMSAERAPRPPVQPPLIGATTCQVTPKDPPPDGWMFVDVEDTQPGQPGYQRNLWFEFSPGCQGKRVTISSSAGERRSITVTQAGYEVLRDFTLISDPEFQAALANRSHEWLRMNIEYEDVRGGQ